MKKIKINGTIYSISSFCKEFNFSKRKVTKLYNAGYHDDELLLKLKESKPKSTAITVNGREFKSKLAAANYYGIPPTTFYRHLKDGDVDKIVKRKLLLDKFDLSD